MGPRILDLYFCDMFFVILLKYIYLCSRRPHDWKQKVNCQLINTYLSLSVYYLSKLYMSNFPGTVPRLSQKLGKFDYVDSILNILSKNRTPLKVSTSSLIARVWIEKKMDLKKQLLGEIFQWCRKRILQMSTYISIAIIYNRS